MPKVYGLDSFIQIFTAVELIEEYWRAYATFDLAIAN
jgi:hypothetical protein